MMELDELRRLFEATDEDFERVRELGKLVTPGIDEFVERLYVYIEDALGPHFEVHFPDKTTLARAQMAARRAWLEFFEAAE